MGDVLASVTVAARFPAFVVANPALSFTSAATVLAAFALTPTPNLIPLVLLLTSIRLSVWALARRRGGHARLTVQALLISMASAVAHLAPSRRALSTPNVALGVISSISFIISSFAIGVVVASGYLTRYTNSSWSQVTLFPALWASAWGFLSKVSPTGQLSTWSPVLGLGPYSWLRPITGQWGVDWVTAAWAVVASEALGDWLMGASERDHPLVDAQPPLIDHQDVQHYDSIARTTSGIKPSSTLPLARSRSLLVLSGLLLALMLPAYFAPYLPAPLYADNATPFGVSCALPVAKATSSGHPSLKDYIGETKRLQSSSNVILWPEGAVHFNSEDEKTQAFSQIQGALDANKYAAISFEEFVPESGAHRATRRNGIALIQRVGSPVLQYYKRNLVPIAESFSMTPGTDSPDIFTINLKPPSGTRKGDWAPGPNYTRPIPLTASICLDFASESSFTSLGTRPAIILAPAKTWHIAVGQAMWEQAKARAAETGSTVVWCDGGEGGISGIASRAYSEILQVGPGSWSKSIGVHYPFDDRRTFFSSGGDLGSFALVLCITGIGGALEMLIRRGEQRHIGRHILAVFRRGRTYGPPSETTNLLD